jgi:DNA-binding beta-propeller fold protein YncE
LWVQRYDGGVNGLDFGSALAVSPDGGTIYVTGESQASNRLRDYATVAYSSTGTQLWVQRYNGPANGTDSAYALAVSPDGGTVYVTGSSQGSGTSSDYATVAYSSTGTQLWVQRYNGPANGNDSPSSLAVSPDGGTVYVTGGSGGGGTGSDYDTVAYSSGGTRLWARRYNGPSTSRDHRDYATSLAVSPDGRRVYVTGSSEGSSSSDYATVAYSSGGTPLWARRYNGSANKGDGARSIAVGPVGGTIYVTGGSIGSDTRYDYATVAYSSWGTQLWVRRYDGGAKRDGYAASLTVSPHGGRVYVTGASGRSYSTDDYATVSYSAKGRLSWVRRYNGPAGGHDAPAAIAVSPSGGTIFVTGSSPGSGTGDDYATVAYAFSGIRQWLRRYDGPVSSHDSANALAIGPGGGKVYVTGGSIATGTGAGGLYDFATVAYRTR